MTYAPPAPLSRFIDIVPPPLSGLGPIRVLEFGDDGYNRIEPSSQVDGITGGGVSRIVGAPLAWRRYTYTLTCQVDYPRAMQVRAAIAFQEERIEAIRILQAATPNAALMEDVAIYIHDQYEYSEMAVTPRFCRPAQNQEASRKQQSLPTMCEPSSLALSLWEPPGTPALTLAP